MVPGKRPLSTKARPAKRPRPQGTVALCLAADDEEPAAASAAAFAAIATEAAEAATEAAAAAAASAATKRAPATAEAATNTAPDQDQQLLDHIDKLWYALAVVQGNVRQVCHILRISDLTKESVGTRGSHMGHVMQGHPWIP